MAALVVPELVAAVEQAAVDATDERLRATGFCPPPMVYMFCGQVVSPYVGFLTCRPFYRGADAGQALRLMGALPAVLAATHVVVVWEHADLCTALELPGESFPTAVVVLEASLSEHTVRWHPFRMHIGSPSPDGLLTVKPEWGDPRPQPAGRLPLPISELLARWRSWVGGDLQQAVAELERDGYQLRWAARS